MVLGWSTIEWQDLSELPAVGDRVMIAAGSNAFIGMYQDQHGEQYWVDCHRTRIAGVRAWALTPDVVGDLSE